MKFTKEKWANSEFRGWQRNIHNDYEQLIKMCKSRTGKTLEEIYGGEKAKEIRSKLIISHIGKESPLKGKKRPEFSGPNHPLYGKKRSETQRRKHSKTMKEKIERGEIDANAMIKRAWGDNPAENKFALENPELEKQALIHLPTEIIIRERKGKKGGITGYYVDFLDREGKIVYEIDGKEHRVDICQIRRDQRKDRILRELGYKVIRIPSGEVLGDDR